MSELNNRAEFAHYDSMTTEELQEILRKHAHGELETEPDTDELYYIMEVLARRKEEQDPQAFRSDEQALEDFRKNYVPQERKKPCAAGWMKTAAAVAAILLVVVMSFGISAQAFDFDIWGKIANWTKEIFQFSYTQPTEPEKENNLELKSLQDALSQYNISQDIIPTWLPEGYIFQEINPIRTPREISISAKFNRNNDELIISIRQTIGVKPEQIEKSEDLVEIYNSNGVDYYIFSNNATLQAAWVVGEFENFIAGKLTIEEMKAMIDSI